MATAPGPSSVPPAPRLTLASLARGLNPALLRRLGWTERAGGVAIPWPTTTGRPAWHLRHCLDPQPGRPRWTWTGFGRTTLLPYLRGRSENHETTFAKRIVKGQIDAK